MKARRRLRTPTRWCESYKLHIFLSFHIVFFCSLPDVAARDTISADTLNISDAKQESLVSAGGKFELGFFTPGGNSSNRRYVGIWYYKVNPFTVVWVANRENPVVDKTGVFGLAQDGELKVFDEAGLSHWNSNCIDNLNLQSNRSARLMDSGNLVFIEENQDDHSHKILWESFKEPTDTFLPGMQMDENTTLTSWKAPDDPAPGDFIFQQDQSNEENQYVIRNQSSFYWRSSKLRPDDMPTAISYLLLNITGNKNEGIELTNNTIDSRNEVFNNQWSPAEHTYIRLKMSSLGRIEYRQWVNEKDWDLIWFKPSDRCNKYSACGKFGSCNVDSGFLKCKCLPGFKPSAPEYWESGDYSGGCLRNMPLLDKSSKFLTLKRMKVGRPDLCYKEAHNESECREGCLNNSDCEAYTYDTFENSKKCRDCDAISGTCCIWDKEIYDLQENLDNGNDINVRVAIDTANALRCGMGSEFQKAITWRDLSNLKVNLRKRDKFIWLWSLHAIFHFYFAELTRTCETCGTYMLPYPLSMGKNCGDPQYFNFQCNNDSGTYSFNTRRGSYPVVSINQEKKSFVIQVKDQESCLSRNSKDVLQLDEESPFSVNSPCYNGHDINSFATSSRGRDMEVFWKPPEEPPCSSSKDCVDWPNSSCNETTDGTKRCLCNANFQWNGTSLNCTQAIFASCLPEIEPEGSSPGGHDNQLEKPSSKWNKMVLVLVVTFTSVTIFVVLLGLIYFWRRRMARRKENREKALRLYDCEKRVKEFLDSDQFNEEDKKGIDVPFFDLEIILEATDYFSDANKLGQGGFGPVYKGKFPEGLLVAVKRLSSGSGQGLEEFKNEVVLIAKLQHRNLVRLLGYCVAGDEKILLYEYMPNKSLDSFIFEYALDGTFSIKSDVFSFGVVLLEIISGKRNMGFYKSENAPSLLGHAWRLWMEDKAFELLDRRLKESCSRNEVMKCINVGLLCVQEDPSDRPTMSNVVFMLGSETATLPTPKQPAFVLRSTPSATASSSSKPDTIMLSPVTAEDVD
ncbi:Bulb-type lectin domain [Dillenia turbinata]|uniref:non-specific serine/threonine protein kinase n=1 Tax=Dillenia turbinata TaxID=194707 RepID=A0AAN8UVR0_9MAGN